MVDEPLRVGILGCGRIAGALAPRGGRPTTHAQAIAENAAFHLVAAADPQQDRAAAFGERWKCEAVEDLVGRDLDVVAICTPDATHADHLVRLLEVAPAPRLIVVEKPLCVTASQSLAIRAAAERSTAGVVVNHSRRFDRGHLAVRDLVAAGGLGPVLGVRWTHYGGWLHNGVHLVDTLRLLLGDELAPIRVARGWEDRPGDPCIDGEFRCARHPEAKILVESYPETAFQLFEGEIRLRDGRVRLLDFGDEIWLDEVVVNAAGERELKVSRRLVPGVSATAMETLYALAARHLRDNDGELTARAGLGQALATMHTLFDTAARLSP